MSTIRFATTEEVPTIITTWHDNFGDPFPYIESFIETYPVEECCIVAIEGNAITAMTFLLPAQMVTKTGLRDAFYIYAMCTSASLRGKNLATLLLDYAADVARQKNALALFLIPASESLFDFYAKRGFENIYQRPQFGAIDLSDLSMEKLMFNHFDSIIATQQRSNLSELSIIWPVRHMRFALRSRMEDGALIKIEELSYTIAANENGEIVEQIPLPLSTTESEYFGMVRFLEPYTFTESQPYFNWGLE